MLIFEAINIKKYYGDQLILSFDSFKIHSGNKIGIVGQNGAGKTTLLNILAGETDPNEGIVRRLCQFAYIRQFSDENIEANTQILKEFGIINQIDHQIVSGGEFTRLKVAEALSRNSILLFADEPTSNLDYEGIDLVKNKLLEVDTLLLVSHDRDLLDTLCNKIVEIKYGKLFFYNGNYSSYQKQKQMETEREWREYEQYKTEKIKLEKVFEKKIIEAANIAKKPKNPTRICSDTPCARSRGSSQKNMERAAKAVLSRIKRLNVKQKPKELLSINLDFSLTDPPQNKIVISCKDLSFSYNKNVIFNNASFKVYNGEKIALLGNNGTGKTTLLNLINNLDQRIYLVPKLAIGYFHQDLKNLDYNKTVLENVMQDSIQSESIIRTVLARLLICGDNVYKKVEVLSGGERIKVSFAKIMLSKANILLLDEPTNYLDITSIRALQNVLCDYDGTVLFVSHDKSFVDAIANRLLILRNNQIHEFEGNLKKYEESIQFTKNTNLETQKLVLQIRLTKVVSKLSLRNADKETLEKEYQNILAQLKSL
ncbi:MAG: ABC-F type ribosomal protection protein [Clostridia bacterium]|nr:ABC-F type ribosomal protection protein [Clostridia bacterium]